MVVLALLKNGKTIFKNRIDFINFDVINENN